MSDQTQAHVDRAMNAYRLAHMLMEGKVGDAVAEALPHLQIAADSWGEALRSQQRADVLVELGRLRQRCGDDAAAVDDFESALRLYRELNLRREAAHAGLLAGLAVKALGQPEQAQQYLERTLAILREVNDPPGIARTELALASTHIDRRNPQLAIEHYRRALPILEQLTKRAEVAHVHEMLGMAYQSAGDHAAAESAFELAVQMKHDQLGDMRGAAKTLSRFADMQRHRGDHQRAMDLYRRALGIHQLRNDQALIAQTLGNIGLVHAASGRHDEAADHYRRCAEMSEQAGERAATAQALYNLAGVELERGQDAVARATLERAVALCDEQGLHRLGERALAVLADLYGDQPAQAFAAKRRRSMLLARLDDHPALLTLLDDIVDDAARLDDHDAAIDALRQSLGRCSSALAAGDIAGRREHLGALLARHGDHAAAAAELLQAIAGWETAGDQSGAARALRSLGTCELHLGASADALAHYQRAVDLAERLSDQKGLAAALVGTGNALAQLQRRDEAKEVLERAAAIRSSLGDDRGTAIIRRATDSL